MVMIYDADTDEVVAVRRCTDDADLAYLSLEVKIMSMLRPLIVVVIEAWRCVRYFC